MQLLKSSRQVDILSVAPMMGWTNPAMQKMLKIIAPNMVFYGQMYHVEAVIRHPEKLRFNNDNLIFQLGGSNPDKFYQAGQVLKKIGVPNININVGCPSNKVQNGNFGVCLMRSPKLLSQCINALKASYHINNLSVKCRIGIDHDDSEAFLKEFIADINEQTKLTKFIIHARKAWLTGLNPKQNRNVPVLNYDRVYAMKAHFPDFHIGINGGIETLTDIRKHMAICDEVMIGRLVMSNLYEIHLLDATLNQYQVHSRHEIVQKLSCFDKEMGLLLQSLFKGIEGGKQWRQLVAKIKTHEDLIELSKQV